MSTADNLKVLSREIGGDIKQSLLSSHSAETSLVPTLDYAAFDTPVIEKQGVTLTGGTTTINTKADWDNLIKRGNTLKNTTVKFKNALPIKLDKKTVYFTGRVWFEMIGGGSVDFSNSVFVLKDGKHTMDFHGEQDSKKISNLMIWGSYGKNATAMTDYDNGRWLFRLLNAKNITFDNISANAALGSGDHIWDIAGGQNIWIKNSVVRGSSVGLDIPEADFRKLIDKEWHPYFAEAIQFDFNYEGALGFFPVGNGERWNEREVFKGAEFDYSGCRDVHIDGVVIAGFNGVLAKDHLNGSNTITKLVGSRMGSHVSPTIAQTDVGLKIFIDKVHFESSVGQLSNRGWGNEAPISIQNPDERNESNYRKDELYTKQATFDFISRHNYGNFNNGAIDLTENVSTLSYDIINKKKVNKKSINVLGGRIEFYTHGGVVYGSVRGAWTQPKTGYTSDIGVKIPKPFRPAVDTFITGIDGNTWEPFKVRINTNGTIGTYAKKAWNGMWLESSFSYASL